MTTSSLYPTHTGRRKVLQSSSEFQTRIQLQRPGRFSNASQTRAPIGRWIQKKKKEADIEYPFEPGEVINYTLDDVSIHPVTTKILPSQLPETKETAQGFHHEANGDFKTGAEFNGCDRRKLKMDQQTCSYSTILNEMTE